MDKLMTKLFSDSSSCVGGQTQARANPFRVLSVRPSKQDGNLKLVHAYGEALEAWPLYSLFRIPGGSHDAVLYHGPPTPNSAIGNMSASVMKSVSTLSLRGQTIQLKMSSMSGNFTIESPVFGRLKWKMDPMAVTTMDLVDSAGLRLARFKPGWTEKGKMEIWVPYDDQLVELVLLSALTATEVNSKGIEIVSEVLGAV